MVFAIASSEKVYAFNGRSRWQLQRMNLTLAIKSTNESYAGHELAVCACTPTSTTRNCEARQALEALVPARMCV
eukprot:6188457-Pleurochrysis_carterae.AAC.3